MESVKDLVHQYASKEAEEVEQIAFKVQLHATEPELRARQWQLNNSKQESSVSKTCAADASFHCTSFSTR